MPIIPATWEAKIGRLQYEASPGKKLARPYLREKLGMVVHTCIQATQEICVGRLRSKVSPRKKCETLSEKNN
jgi:hypothetical protein